MLHLVLRPKSLLLDGVSQQIEGEIVRDLSLNGKMPSRCRFEAADLRQINSLVERMTISALRDRLWPHALFLKPIVAD